MLLTSLQFKRNAIQVTYNNKCVAISGQYWSVLGRSGHSCVALVSSFV